jgi:hypothetical protein
MSISRLRIALASVVISFSVASLAGAAVVTTHTDADPTASAFVDNGSIGVNEYAASFANGGGSGFGGTVGSAALSMDSDVGSVYFGFDPGAALNDNAVLYLDTRSGGVLDSQMDDRADGGRFAASNLTRDSNDAFPINPDFAVVFGNFGTVVFELTTNPTGEGTPTNGHLTFQVFQGDQTGGSDALVREIALPRSLLGNPSQVDFFVGYSSNNGFNSNESLPASNLNASGNPGFGSIGGLVTYDNFNRFVVSAVPEVSSAFASPVGIIVLGGASLVSKRWRPAKVAG